MRQIDFDATMMLAAMGYILPFNQDRQVLRGAMATFLREHGFPVRRAIDLSSMRLLQRAYRTAMAAQATE